MNTKSFPKRHWAARLLHVLVLAFIAAFFANFAPRNLTPYVSSLLALALLTYAFWSARLPLIVASVIFLTTMLSPLDVDLQGSGGDMRILPVSVGLVSNPNQSPERWNMGCIASSYDPLWMLTWRSTSRASVLGKLLASNDVAASTSELIDQVYGKANQELACRVLGVDRVVYCMEAAHSVIKESVQGKRLYVVATGRAIRGAHVTPGLVEAFIVELKGGRAIVTAQSSRLQLGAWGEPPGSWNLQLLGPNDNWGWTAADHYQQMGFSVDQTIFLGLLDGSIQKLAEVTTSYDDTGNCEDTACELSLSTFNTNILIDSAPAIAAFYPLVVTVNGRRKGEAVNSKKWTLLFDEAKHRYVYPKTWNLDDASIQAAEPKN